VHAIAAPVGRGRWVVRHYRRGGLFGPYLGDRYLRAGRPRAFVELEASRQLLDGGVRTPRVVAAAHYPSGVFYRADIVTEWVAGQTLVDVLREATTAETRQAALIGVAGAIQTLASLRAYHVDLNANNLLLDPRDGESPWVLDLDRMRFGVPADRAAPAMGARLLRSLTKLGVGIDTLEMARGVLPR